jgi:hypothetical protein
MSSFEFINLNGVPVEVRFDYTAEDRPSLHCPGEPENFDIEAVFAVLLDSKGNKHRVDIWPVLPESDTAVIIGELVKIERDDD